MSTSNNRVEAALMEWSKREASERRVHGPSLERNKNFHKERLKAYRKIYEEFRGTKDPEEKSRLKVVKGQIDQMEKGLFSKTVQAFRRADRLLSRVDKFLNPVLNKAFNIAGAKVKQSWSNFRDNMRGRTEHPDPTPQELADSLKSTPANPVAGSTRQQPLLTLKRPSARRNIYDKIQSRGMKK